MPYFTTTAAPAQLWLVRHGQSAGNVANEAALAARQHMLDITTRDMDTPLSPLGEQQAAALGRWFGALPVEERPQVILVSPYVRAHDTARRLVAAGAIDLPLRLDERLREKEFGILDRYTRYGIQEKYPELAEQRAHVGKFYFRPPGGESWCDVILRLRSLMEMVAREYAGQRVLVVAHQAIVSCLRYLLEGLDEAQILAIDQAEEVPNCGVTAYRFDEEGFKQGQLVPQLVNFTAPLEREGAPITSAPDVTVAPKA